jgi:hypothetical protein
MVELINSTFDNIRKTTADREHSRCKIRGVLMEFSLLLLAFYILINTWT